MKNSIYFFECYFKNPLTGEAGWDIKFVRVYADTLSVAKNRLNTIPHFDCIIVGPSAHWDKAAILEEDIRRYANGADYWIIEDMKEFKKLEHEHFKN